MKSHIKYLICILSITFTIGNIAGQQIAKIVPSCATAGQTLNVTVTGVNTHFVQGSATALSFDDGFFQGSATIRVNSITAVSDSSLYANITIPSNQTTRYLNVHYAELAPGSNQYKTTRMRDGFYVSAPSNPRITSVSPKSGVAGQTLNVTITGENTHFVQGSGTTLTFEDGFFSQGSSTARINSLTPINDTNLTANITIPTNCNESFLSLYYHEYDLNRNMYASTLKDVFHVNAASNPRITSIAPKTAKAGQTLNVTITGVNTHFVQGSGTALLFDDGFIQGSATIQINSMTPVNDTCLIANMTIPNHRNPGFLDLYYTEFDLNSTRHTSMLKEGFYVGPYIDYMTPAVSDTNTTMTAIIHCLNANFAGSIPPANIWLSNNDLGCTNILEASNATVLSSNSISATFDIPSNATRGFWNMNIKNGADGYFYKSKILTIGNATSITPIIDEPNIYLYPNPAESNLTIRLNSFENLSYVIYNSTGLKVKNGTLNSTSNEISIESFNDGLYFIQFSDKNKVISNKKFIKY